MTGQAGTGNPEAKETKTRSLTPCFFMPGRERIPRKPTKTLQTPQASMQNAGK